MGFLSLAECGEKGKKMQQQRNREQVREFKIHINSAFKGKQVKNAVY